MTRKRAGGNTSSCAGVVSAAALEAVARGCQKLQQLHAAQFSFRWDTELDGAPAGVWGAGGGKQGMVD